MGRTLPSITQVFLHEQDAFSGFRRALRRSDQQVLDGLFASARQHVAAAAYASHALPFESFLLAMLLEQRKELLRLQQFVETLAQSELLHAGLEQPYLQVDLPDLGSASYPGMIDVEAAADMDMPAGGHD